MLLLRTINRIINIFGNRQRNKLYYATNPQKQVLILEFRMNICCAFRWKSYGTMTTEHAIPIPPSSPFDSNSEMGTHRPLETDSCTVPPETKSEHMPTWAPPYYQMYYGHFLFLRLSLNTGDQAVLTGSGLHLDLHIISSPGGNPARVLPVNKNPWWRGSRREAWDWKPKASHWAVGS